VSNKAFGHITDVSLNSPYSGGVVGFECIVIDSSGNNVLTGGSQNSGVSVPFSYSDTAQGIWQLIVAGLRALLSDPTLEVVCMPGSFDQFVLNQSY
jgi:hypothetical protein